MTGPSTGFFTKVGGTALSFVSHQPPTLVKNPVDGPVTKIPQWVPELSTISPAPRSCPRPAHPRPRSSLISDLKISGRETLVPAGPMLCCLYKLAGPTDSDATDAGWYPHTTGAAIFSIPAVGTGAAHAAPRVRRREWRHTDVGSAHVYLWSGPRRPKGPQ